ncbi:hypothetical protein [Marinimicrobium koreense]|uniref:hypothetical protein n=1 Tax=Marinimicrobium koreense TaxID=306545 RepID=UPI003F6FAF94
MSESSFDATASFVGYLYQVRYALLLALKKIDEVDDPDNCFVSIETIDDIAFLNSESPTDLLQTKHHSTPGNIGNRSSDLWKTLRVWSELLLSQPNDFESANFSLVTTETGAPGSIAELLGCDPQKRDTESALKEMRKICQETSNAGNLSAYESFAKLNDWQQEKLVKSAYVIGLSPDIWRASLNISLNQPLCLMAA